MKYWAYINGEIPGSYAAEELPSLPGFSMTTLVCPAAGEIAEKNWRRAGEFVDVAAALSARENEAPPSAPVAALPAETFESSDVNALIDSTSTKLFSHVADLMAELESRREEKGLIVSLQRHVAALTEELAQTRERSDLLEMRLPRIAELEETHRKSQAALEALQSSLLTHERSLNEARAAAEKSTSEAEAAKRRLQETLNDLALRNRVVDTLSKNLGEKELSLVKSLSVIRRLEEDLNRLCPDPAPVLMSARRVSASPETPLPSYTFDEPTTRPLELCPPSERPKAQEALVNFVKRIFPGQTH
jgi:hypothetical protein